MRARRRAGQAGANPSVTYLYGSLLSYQPLLVSAHRLLHNHKSLPKLFTRYKTMSLKNTARRHASPQFHSLLRPILPTHDGSIMPSQARLPGTPANGTAKTQRRRLDYGQQQNEGPGAPVSPPQNSHSSTRAVTQNDRFVPNASSMLFYPKPNKQSWFGWMGY